MNNWSQKMYKIIEIINDTIPSYRIDKLPERYDESLLEMTELSMRDNDSVVKKLNLKNSIIGNFSTLLIQIQLKK